jgi:hypothetical protein
MSDKYYEEANARMTRELESMLSPAVTEPTAEEREASKSVLAKPAEPAPIAPPKLVTDMTDSEYAAAKSAAINHRPAAKRADLGDARSMSDAEFKAAKAKAVRDSYR